MTQILYEPTRSGRSAAGWVDEVAGKLARREGRNDSARDTEILGWCREAATQFADARVQAFVPLLVERIVGDRMRRSRDERGCAPAVTECAGREVSR